MRRIALLALLLAWGCSPRDPTAAEIAAVYEAFLEADESDVEHVLLQDSEVPVSVHTFPDWPPGKKIEVSRGYSPEVREAVHDLIARGRTPRLLPAEAFDSEPRISADSVQVLVERIRVHRLHRLPDRASVVQFSAVGFNRDRSVAVVLQSTICGELCGGAIARVFRKHPGGWMAAEVLVSVLS
jgi:hypothetical protein